MGLDPVPSVGVAGPDLPRGRRRPARAEEEAPFGMAPVRLSGAERVLAARRHRVRADRRAQVRDLPAHRRPLPLRGRLPRRLGRDLRGGDHRVRQGRRRSRRAPTAAVRQRGRAQPLTARSPGPARRPHDRPWASSRSPASPTSRPPRARTNASIRHCSATSTSSHSPTPWPNCRPRSTRSTTSTTPSVPTRACPVASHPRRRGRPPRRPRRHDLPGRGSPDPPGLGALQCPRPHRPPICPRTPGSRS